MLDGGNHFYLAAVWEAAIGDWPLCYRVVTVAANREVARYQERHGAIIHRRQVMQWLDHGIPEGDLLDAPPARKRDVLGIVAVIVSGIVRDAQANSGTPSMAMVGVGEQAAF